MHVRRFALNRDSGLEDGPCCLHRSLVCAIPRIDVFYLAMLFLWLRDGDLSQGASSPLVVCAKMDCEPQVLHTQDRGIHLTVY